MASLHGAEDCLWGLRSPSSSFLDWSFVGENEKDTIQLMVFMDGVEMGLVPLEGGAMGIMERKSLVERNMVGQSTVLGLSCTSDFSAME
jgi:hypothetical protein